MDIHRAIRSFTIGVIFGTLLIGAINGYYLSDSSKLWLIGCLAVCSMSELIKSIKQTKR